MAYEYAHEKMDREQFEAAYRLYSSFNGYEFKEYMMLHEWKYYVRNKCWFAAYIDDQLRRYVGLVEGKYSFEQVLQVAGKPYIIGG